MTDDPVLRRRARIARLTDVGQRVGYTLFGIAIVLFVIGFVSSYSDALVAAIVACLGLG